MFEKIGTFLGGIALAVAGFFGVTPAVETQVVQAPVVETRVQTVETQTPERYTQVASAADSDEETFGGFSPAAGGTYRLRTSIGSTDTSIPLSSFKEPVTGNALTMTSLNTDIGYATLDPQSPTRKELISFTGVTQNSDGSATLTGVSRGLAFQFPYTASSTLRKSHPGQSILILSDAPQVFNEYARIRSNEVITGQWTFATFPIAPSTTPATPTTTGMVQLATGQEAASSTLYGSTGYRLGLHTGISTSTAGVPYTIPVTGSDGRLNVLLSSTTTVNARSITYTASSTYVKKADVKYIRVELWGAGGSGAARSAAGAGSSGGGGGQYFSFFLSTTTLSSSTPITIGAGGIAAASSTEGLPGGNTQFGTSSSQIAWGGGGGNGIASAEGAFGGSVLGHGTTSYSRRALLSGLCGIIGCGAASTSIATLDAGGGSATGGVYTSGSSINGGAGGASSDASNNQGAPGVSVRAGNGGTASPSGGGNGGYPAGGGGSCAPNCVATPGRGADGMAIITEYF